MNTMRGLSCVIAVICAPFLAPGIVGASDPCANLEEYLVKLEQLCAECMKKSRHMTGYLWEERLDFEHRQTDLDAEYHVTLSWLPKLLKEDVKVYANLKLFMCYAASREAYCQKLEAARSVIVGRCRKIKNAK